MDERILICDAANILNTAKYQIPNHQLKNEITQVRLRILKYSDTTNWSFEPDTNKDRNQGERFILGPATTPIDQMSTSKLIRMLKTHLRRNQKRITYKDCNRQNITGNCGTHTSKSKIHDNPSNNSMNEEEPTEIPLQTHQEKIKDKDKTKKR